MRGPGLPEPVTAEDLARELPITGYLDQVSARPGGRLEARISAQAPGTYTADVVRIRHADPNPDGPGLIYDPTGFDAGGPYPARRQDIDLGSYARLPAHPIWTADRVLFSVLIQPRLLTDAPATLAAALNADARGWTVTADRTGLTLTLTDGAGQRDTARLPCSMAPRGWYRVWAGWDRTDGALLIGCAQYPDGTAQITRQPLTTGPLPDNLPLTLAAQKNGPQSALHFNGRLQDPAFHDTLPDTDTDTDTDTPPPLPATAPPGALRAWWDFAIAIDTQAIVDRGPHGLAGRLRNVPTRAVRGADWPGQAMDWQTAPRAYGAIHFHADDLHDCGWDTDFTLHIPQDAQSGVYGLRLRQGDVQDILPFYVIPPKGQRTNRVCVLASTFTHQAYANHARGNCDDAMRARMAAWGTAPNPDDYPVYGGSTYNYHADGTGVSLSSRLRPTLTIRPGFLTFNDARGSGLRHFSADSHLHYWLDQRGIGFDIVTDEDLDREGTGLIASYPVLMTGSHPEYHTPATLDAIQGYTGQGGKLMYLGGNGFYWRIAHIPTLPGMIELRRAEGGIRAWAADAGESYHQLDGGYGGLWRRNGRPPQSIAGVGFSAQGVFDGSYYRRTPASFHPGMAWIFDGVDEDRLGDYGVSGGGAAGFELDRADRALGTPDSAVVLARSEAHGDSFVTVPEELLSHLHTVTGEPPADLIRAEIVYADLPGGGALFATGSISFCGSLNHRDGDNGCSRMTENVLRRFAGL